MTILSPLTVQNQPACRQISLSSHFEVTFFRRTVTIGSFSGGVACPAVRTIKLVGRTIMYLTLNGPGCAVRFASDQVLTATPAGTRRRSICGISAESMAVLICAARGVGDCSCLWLRCEHAVNPTSAAQLIMSSSFTSRYLSPNTSCMSYKPGSCETAHLAARNAPRANVSRLLARCINSTRSPAAPNVTM